MADTKAIKPKAVGASRRIMKEPNPEKARAACSRDRDLHLRVVRNNRASSCPRPSGGAQQSASARSCERRITSSKKPSCREGTRSVSRDTIKTKCEREQRRVRAESQSHGAFTVICPDPRKRGEIQRKAEAELAALEELRLSRAMASVSISPSSVGGCLSLDEVRLKQQQEMTQAQNKQKLVQRLF